MPWILFQFFVESIISRTRKFKPLHPSTLPTHSRNGTFNIQIIFFKSYFTESVNKLVSRKYFLPSSVTSILSFIMVQAQTTVLHKSRGMRKGTPNPAPALSKIRELQKTNTIKTEKIIIVPAVLFLLMLHHLSTALHKVACIQVLCLS